MPRWKWRPDAMIKAPVSHSKDPDLLKAPQALLRAAKKAKKLAEQTGTPFVVRQAEAKSATANERIAMGLK